MSHEQSETVKRNGKWVNVYGRKKKKAGKVLPGESRHDTVEQAVKAAKTRSRAYDSPAMKGLIVPAHPQDKPAKKRNK